MANMRHMTSMEREDDEKLDHVATYPLVEPDFPPGLRISLTEKEFEKLGLDHSVAEVGGVVHGHFIGEIKHVSHTQSEGGEECCRCEIQITHLDVESEDEENEEEE